MPSLSTPEMNTEPSSSMSTFAPVSAWMPWMTLPFVPMTSEIFSTGIFMETIFGAYSETSGRGAGMALSRTSSMI